MKNTKSSNQLYDTAKLPSNHGSENGDWRRTSLDQLLLLVYREGFGQRLIRGWSKK
jgi:hypothetical protein